MTMFQIEYSKSSNFECEYCMEMILVGTIKLGEEKVALYICSNREGVYIRNLHDHSIVIHMNEKYRL
jgi:hypothetical protein